MSSGLRSVFVLPFMAPPKLSPRGVGAPQAKFAKSYPRKVIRPKRNFLTELLSLHSAQSSDPSGDRTKEGISTNRSRDSSDFDFAKVLARDRSRADFENQ